MVHLHRESNESMFFIIVQYFRLSKVRMYKARKCRHVACHVSNLKVYVYNTNVQFMQ